MDDDVRVLAEAVLKKLRREELDYTTILNLTRSQKDALANRDVDLLSEILRKKQNCIDRITAVQKELLKMRPSWEKVRDMAGEQARSEIRSVQDSISAALNSIVAIEKENLDMATALQRDVAGKLTTLKQQRAVASHYSAGREGSHGFMDKRL